MTASTRPRRPSKAVSYIPATPPPIEVVCTTPGDAIRLVCWLGSSDASQATNRHRRAVAAAVTDWLHEYEGHVQQIELGCQRLLLQAAEMVGAASPSRLKS